MTQPPVLPPAEAGSGGIPRREETTTTESANGCEVPTEALALGFAPAEWQTFRAEIKEALARARKALAEGSRAPRYRSPGWDLARHVKANPRCAALCADEAGELVDRVLADLYPGEPEEYLWQHALGEVDNRGNELDPYYDFLGAWNKCTAEGPDPLEIALEMASGHWEDTGSYGPRLAGAKHRQFRRYLAVAESLQLLRRENTIFLPVKRVAEMLNSSPQQVSRWSEMAQERGFLELLEKGGPGRADEFLFHNPPRPTGS